MFKSIGKRLMGALSGIATRGEVQAIDDRIAAAVKTGVTFGKRFDKAEEPEAPVEVKQPRQRYRHSRNTTFHAKRGGLVQYGTVAHDMASNKTFQFMYNPLLTTLLYRSGAMGVDHKG